MKKLLILLFSILISFNSYGEWTESIKNVDGDTYYIDKDTIKENNRYVYWWEMGDFITPYTTFVMFTEVAGIMSEKSYKEGDCGVVRYKNLSVIYYTQSMGKGEGLDNMVSLDWVYPPPDSVYGYILNYVCDYVD